MAPGRRTPSWLPWALCWISLGLLAVGLALRIAFPEGPADSPVLAVTGVLGAVFMPLVGALIAARLPTNPYGWLWCALGVAFGALFVSDGLRRAGAIPGWLAAVLAGVTFLPALCLLVFVLLLFPTGHLPGPRWRWLGRAAVADVGIGLLALPFALDTVQDIEPTPWSVGGPVGAALAALVQAVLLAMFVLVLVAAVSVLLRFRRAGPVERQQLKWFVLAAVLVAATIAIDLLPVPIGEPLWTIVDAVSFALLPLAVAIAVLRYRLYEIDRIISRTVSYGLLTGGLLALYFGLVALLRVLLAPVTGSSALAVAGSTLAVAAVFNPARRKLQAAVDRRFDRAGYDAGRAVDAFAARLRSEVDLDQVAVGLRETVAATVAPTRVSLWLRERPVRIGA